MQLSFWRESVNCVIRCVFAVAYVCFCCCLLVIIKTIYRVQSTGFAFFVVVAFIERKTCNIWRIFGCPSLTCALETLSKEFFLLQIYHRQRHPTLYFNTFSAAMHINHAIDALRVGCLHRRGCKSLSGGTIITTIIIIGVLCTNTVRQKSIL